MTPGARRALAHALALLALGPLAAAAACAQADAGAGRVALPPRHAPRPTTVAISVADLMTRLYAFADDSMLGREAGTEGNRRATDYLAREAARAGLVPAGDSGGWFQALPFVRRGVDPARSRLAPDAGPPLVLWRDYLPVVRRGAPRPFDGARVVFGGRLDSAGGAPLGTAQAAGRVVVLLPRPGQAAGRLALFSPDRRGSRLAGAAALLVVVPDESLADLREYASSWDVRLEESPDTASAPSYFLVTRRAAERLLGRPLAGAATGTLGGVARGLPAFVRDPAPARNVVGRLPGTDPALRGEYVALGAHNDHVGVGRPVKGDSIFNGADDDGSGSVALLEIAEAMAAAPAPRRSVLFVWHTAEELGMVGSRWFTDHPTVPLDSIVAQLNVDMIGRGTASDVPGGGPAFLMVVGARRLAPELGEVVERVNRERAEPFRLDWSWDAPDHPERIYCRSDHYMYARKGIPVAFFMTGLHADYHQPSDEPRRIDYPHLAAITGYLRDLAVTLADEDHRPRVSGKGSAGC